MAPPAPQPSTENLAAAQQNLVHQQKQGVLKVDLKGFHWVVDAQAPPNAPVFVSVDSLNSAVEGDTVVAQLHQRTDGKVSGVIIKIVSRAQPAQQPPPVQPSTPPRLQSPGEDSPQFVEGPMMVDSKGRGVITVALTGEVVALVPSSIQATGATPGDVLRVQIQANASKTSDGQRIGYAIAVTSRSSSSSSLAPQRSPSQPQLPVAAQPLHVSVVSQPPPKSYQDLQRELNELSMQLGMHQFQLQMTQQRGAPQAEIDALMAQQYHLVSLMQTRQGELRSIALQAQQQQPHPQPAAGPLSAAPPLVLPPGHVPTGAGHGMQVAPVGNSKKGPDFIWAPGMPNFMKLTELERTALKQQFQTIDKDNRGYIGEKELRESLGLVGFDDVLAKLFVRAFDNDNDKMISRDDFMNTMAVMLKGTSVEKLNGTFPKPKLLPGLFSLSDVSKHYSCF